jgi:integrase
LDPFALTSALLAEFLLYLFDVRKLQPSTIKGYRSAIARVYSLCGLPDPGADRDVTRLLNNFSLNRPRSVRLFPKWNIELVLNFLAHDPFEPLEAASLERLTTKTVFLIALATAGRVSELHALSARDDCLRFNQDGSVSMLTFPGFVAKNRLPEVGSQQHTLKPLGEEVFCPVRALDCYIRRTKNKRKPDDPLFLPLKSGAKTSPQLISSWIKSLIQEAYQTAADHSWLEVAVDTPGEGRTPRGGAGAGESGVTNPNSTLTASGVRTVGEFPVSHDTAQPEGVGGSGVQRSGVSDLTLEPSLVSEIRDASVPTQQTPDLFRPAHELRAISASLALYRGAALSDITKAVGWSSASTFGRFYLRHLSNGESNVHVQQLLRLPASPQQRSPSH